MNSLEQTRVRLEMLKASFGGDRSAAGRYAAEQRWLGHVKESVANSILDRVKANGGLSVKILSGEEPTVGFMVAQQGHNLEVLEADFFDAKKGKKILSDYLKAKKLVFGKDQYLGLWWNKEQKEVSLDVVDNIENRSEATKAGRERNQQAIWDVQNQQEINTGGTGDRTTEPTAISSEAVKAFGGDDRPRDRRVSVPGLGKILKGKQRVVQQTIRADFEKASFGGDRSAAGRYAAEQRWKGHAKKEKPQSGAQSVRQVADRIREAQKSVSDAGFKIDLKKSTDSHTGDYKRFADRRRDLAEKTFDETCAFVYPDNYPSFWDMTEFGYKRNAKGWIKNNDQLPPPLPDRFRLGALMIHKALTVNNAFQSDGIITVMNGDIVAAAGCYRLFPKQKIPAVLFDFAGSHGVVKGAGSAIFSAVVSVANRQKSEIVLGALPDSVPFWEGQGFRNDGFNPNDGVFNMTLTREKVAELHKEIYRD